jgi:hypothetical protein
MHRILRQVDMAAAVFANTLCCRQFHTTARKGRVFARSTRERKFEQSI